MPIFAIPLFPGSCPTHFFIIVSGSKNYRKKIAVGKRVSPKILCCFWGWRVVPPKNTDLLTKKILISINGIHRRIWFFSIALWTVEIYLSKQFIPEYQKYLKIHPYSHWALVCWGSLFCNHPFKTTANQSDGLWWLQKLTWCVLLLLSLICNSACLVSIGSSMILSSLVQWLRNFSSRVNLIGILVITKHIIKLISTDKMSIKPALCAQSIQDMSYTSAVAALPILNTCIWSLMQD